MVDDEAKILCFSRYIFCVSLAISCGCTFDVQITSFEFKVQKDISQDAVAKEAAMHILEV